ncbi:ABC transporter permease [Thermogladius sp. 4427co]|uniref:ABC transporter permease n=1 Tax=Thermogladius sp. 4427co TaxID=3450718 RepID=UPI003F7A4A83
MRKPEPYFTTIINTGRRAWRKRLRFRIGIIIITAIIVMAISAPFIAPYPEEGWGLIPLNQTDRVGQPPSLSHLFGTDDKGRDLLSRVLIGASTALLQIVLVTGISLLIGLILGIVAAYYKGFIEHVLNYIIEVFLAMPAILLAAPLKMVFGPGLQVVVASMVLTWWAWYGRIAYVYARSITEMDYVTLSKLAYIPGYKIIYRHIIRNASPPVVVQAITDLGSVLLEASSINFLGFGLPPDSPDWGVIAQNGFYYILKMPWISLIPGFFILITALGFSMVGDSLREEIDPKLRRRWKLWF